MYCFIRLLQVSTLRFNSMGTELHRLGGFHSDGQTQVQNAGALPTCTTQISLIQGKLILLCASVWCISVRFAAAVANT